MSAWTNSTSSGTPPSGGTMSSARIRVPRDRKRSMRQPPRRPAPPVTRLRTRLRRARRARGAEPDPVAVDGALAEVVRADRLEHGLGPDAAHAHGVDAPTRLQVVVRDAGAAVEAAVEYEVPVPARAVVQRRGRSEQRH